MRRSVVIAAIVGACVLSACDGSGGGPAATPTLDGTAWVLDQAASTLEIVAPEVEVTARFDDGAVSGDAGCNQYLSSYEVDGDRFSIVEPIGRTLRACAPPASNVEAAYLELLPSARSFVVRGSRLVLATDTEGVSLVYTAADQRS